MRLVAMSDLHLGFRAYARLNSQGINQREIDVSRTFARTVDATIAQRPDLVTIAGDIFHQVRPSNTAIKFAFTQFARLRLGLPDAEIVMVAGNHDTPRSAESGCILGLFAGLGIHVVDGAAQAFDFPALDCSVLAVPDNQHARPELRPAGSRRYNVLVLHGEATGISPKGSPAAEKELSADDMHAGDWDYIALGHYHVYREIAPNCFYSGAIDYTSSDIWGERAEEIEKGIPGKGIVSRDLATGRHTFLEIPVSREVVDLPAFSAAGMAADEASDAIADAVEAIPDGIDGKIVRLKVLDAERHIIKDVDHKMLRDYSLRALHWQLDWRRPEPVRTEVHDAVRRRAPLNELIETMLRARPLPADMDRDAFAALGTQYFIAAGEDRSIARLAETSAEAAA